MLRGRFLSERATDRRRELNGAKGVGGSPNVVNVDLEDRKGIRTLFVHGVALFLEPEHLSPQAYLPTGDLVKLKPEMRWVSYLIHILLYLCPLPRL